MKKVVMTVMIIALVSATAVAQDFPRVEVFGGYSLMRVGIADADLNELRTEVEEEFDGADFSFKTTKLLKQGFTGSAAFNLTRSFGIVTDFRFNQGYPLEASASEGQDSLTAKAKLRNMSFMAGPRFTFRQSEIITPFVHALVGLDQVKFSGEISARIEGESFSEGGELLTSNGLGMALGGGLDLNVSRSVAIRLIQADYYLNRHEGEHMNNVNLAFGVVFRLGGN
jgi:opacity protein-like surface antigen